MIETIIEEAKTEEKEMRTAKRGRRSISAYREIKNLKTPGSDQRSASALDKTSKRVQR